MAQRWYREPLTLLALAMISPLLGWIIWLVIESIQRAFDLTKSDWASWVQAVGSIAAITGAFYLAKYQADRQHQSAIATLTRDKAFARLDAGKAVLALVQHAAKTVQGVKDSFPDRDTVHRKGSSIDAAGLEQIEIEALEGRLASIDLQLLPDVLIAPLMRTTSLMRYVRIGVENLLKHHREVDAEGFDAFFRLLEKMQGQLRATRSEVQDTIRVLEALTVETNAGPSTGRQKDVAALQ